VSVLTIANLLFIFGIVSFFLHSYFRNTADFEHYRAIMGFPVASRLLKYAYINSFFLFALSALGFLVSVALSSFHLETAPRDLALLALSIVLAAIALRLVTLPDISRWRMRTE
jgi:hypothetical protein